MRTIWVLQSDALKRLSLSPIWEGNLIVPARPSPPSCPGSSTSIITTRDDGPLLGPCVQRYTPYRRVNTPVGHASRSTLLTYLCDILACKNLAIPLSPQETDPDVAFALLRLHTWRTRLSSRILDRSLELNSSRCKPPLKLPDFSTASLADFHFSIDVQHPYRGCMGSPGQPEHCFLGLP